MSVVELEKFNKLLSEVCCAWAKAGQENSASCFNPYADYHVEKAKN